MKPRFSRPATQHTRYTECSSLGSLPKGRFLECTLSVQNQKSRDHIHRESQFHNNIVVVVVVVIVVVVVVIVR